MRCELRGTYAAAVGVIVHVLVAACSACAGVIWRVICVDVMKVHSGMHICMGKVSIWGTKCRVQGRVQVGCKAS